VTRAHDAVIVARLESGPLASSVYYDKPIPDDLKKYLRVRTGTGRIVTDRLAGPLGPRTKTYYLTGVGTSPTQAAWYLEQATDLFLNWVPTVAGWSCHRLTFESSQPVDADPEVDGRFFGVDQWDLFTSPVSA
jgi:hypothetical protein